MHLAAESHVDRSIDGPGEFMQTNVVGTFTLLQAAPCAIGGACLASAQRGFRFHHISTDEVFGSLGEDGLLPRGIPLPAELALLGLEGRLRPFRARLAPHLRPADADHQLLQQLRAVPLSREADPAHDPQRARGQAPAGLRQGRERARLALRGRPCRRADSRGRAGQVGESYNIGGWNERTNIDVVRAICALVDEMAPDAAIGPRESLITFVADRPGHDLRYAIDASKIERELGWRPAETFETGLRKTVRVVSRQPRLVGARPLRRLPGRAARRRGLRPSSVCRTRCAEARRTALQECYVLESKPTAIPDVKIVTPKRFGDERGYLLARSTTGSASRRPGSTSSSSRTTTPCRRQAGTVRGLHFQSRPSPRTSSSGSCAGASSTWPSTCAAPRRPTAGTWRSSSRPRTGASSSCRSGFAHGFCTLEPDTEVLYKVTAYYSPRTTMAWPGTIRRSAIAWPVDSDEALLSDKDRRQPRA